MPLTCSNLCSSAEFPFSIALSIRAFARMLRPLNFVSAAVAAPITSFGLTSREYEYSVAGDVIINAKTKTLLLRQVIMPSKTSFATALKNEQTMSHLLHSHLNFV